MAEEKVHSLGKFFTTKIFPLLTRQVKKAMPRACVEHVVTRLPEDQTQLVVVVGHQCWLWCLL